MHTRAHSALLRPGGQQFDDFQIVHANGEIIRKAFVQLASALVQAQRFAEGLHMLGETSQPSLDYFLENLAECSLAFDEAAPGLAARVLQEVIRVIGWVRMDWRQILEEPEPPSASNS